MKKILLTLIILCSFFGAMAQCNMPSQATVMKEGIEAGDIMGKLLQQVEELTLHVIKLNEENKALKASLLTK